VTTRDPNRRMNRASERPSTESARIPTTDSRYEATGGSSSQSTGDVVKEKAGQMASSAQETVSQTADQARQKGMSQIAARKSQAADSLTDVSHAVSQVGSQLRQSNHESLAQYADMATQRVDRLASYMRERDIGEMVDEAQEFARRRPALVLAGAFALGVIGARFLKSSSPRSGARSSGSPYRSRASRYGGADFYGQSSGYSGYPNNGVANQEWRQPPDAMRERESGRLP
jgi:gas vesicle protein